MRSAGRSRIPGQSRRGWRSWSHGLKNGKCENRLLPGMTDLLPYLGEVAVHRMMSLLCLCLGVLLAVPNARAEIQVGAAVRVITPDPLLPVSGGMGRPNPAKEKRGELTARAMVFRKGDVTVGVVALDLLGFPSVLGDRVRAKVSRIPAS